MPTGETGGGIVLEGNAGVGAAAGTAILSESLVVPAGALVRGHLRCRSLLLAGEIVGDVHCTDGPVVIRAGGMLTGRLVASGDVHVRGTVTAADDGGVVVSTRGRLILDPGSRVDGDVRSGLLDLHDGAMLVGLPRSHED